MDDRGLTEPTDDALVARIADRALALGYSSLSGAHIAACVSACHRDTPLRLAELLGADDLNFCHDVTGILTRNAGFRLRYAARAPFDRCIETLDTGITRTVLNADWPIYHQLERTGAGWLITRNVCGGDHSLAERRSYATERLARRAWAQLEKGSRK